MFSRAFVGVVFGAWLGLFLASSPLHAQQFTLTVSLAGTGSGTVTSSPAGIDCGVDCDELYDEGTVVTLTATPDGSSSFTGWSGDADCSDGSVTMGAAVSCTATFDTIQHQLSVSLAGTGSGTVTSSPAGIDCGVDCDELYDQGTVVTLTPTPDGSSSFTGWSGDADCSDGSVTMGAAVSCTATFDTIQHQLAVSLAGTGSGTVTSSPAGIDCGVDCDELYDQGTVVTLTPTPDAGSSFTGWSGDADCSDGSVTMGAAVSCTATFDTIQHQLTVSLAGTGSGTVTSSPAGIDCGIDCDELYDQGTAVTLTATPDGTSSFIGWSGDADCADGSVTMNAAVSCTATFDTIQHQLAVSLAGTGSGTVTSSPAGIDCGADCDELFDQGTVVTLTPTPDAGSSFAGWSGDADCTDGSVTMSAAVTCTATFDTIQHQLSVSLAGTGSGTVTSSPAGIDCGADCDELYDQGTVVTLTATPDGSSSFTGWSGDADCADGSVTMSAAVSCTATFDTIQHQLAVSLAGTGSGTVTSSPAGIDCGVDCDELYDQGTVVTLAATPDAGSSFVGWSGDADCADGSVTMSAAVNCTATFDTIQHQLSVSLAGTGSGTVTSSPAGIDCGVDCDELYDEGTVVTLTATPDAASTFTGWSGDADCDDGSVTMTTAVSCTATFDTIQHQLAVSLAGTGSGTVTSSPPGIDCGADCDELYDEGTVVTLTATPDAGSTFIGWSGDVDCADGSVTMSAAVSCTATFDTIQHQLTVSLAGTGSGTVTSSPPGIDCGADCDELYDEGTVVALTPTPDPGSLFAGWSGDADCSDGSVTMTTAVSCTATFDTVQHQLSITLAGTGGGTVTSSPPGIDCGADCDELYDEGTVVNLVATPDVGASFVGWSGDADCSDGSVVMTTDLTCTATFDLLQFSLGVSKDGTGSGTVTSDPAGIDCGLDCGELYDYGTVVTMTATPDPGSIFVGWGGSPDCTDGVVTMVGDRGCVATFDALQRNLTVTLAGTGSGTVTSSPAGIDCGSDCDELFDEGTVVDLTATPDPGSTFIGWSGDADCSDGSVTMTQDLTCTATFDLIEYTLTIVLAGDGAGTVTSAPAGIDCPADCDEAYVEDTVVDLTATPDDDSVFVGWTGDADCTDGSVTMTEDLTCTATFDALPPNVVIIVIDDWGLEHWNAMGIGVDPPPTLNIDAYAASGVRFDNAWAYPVCSSARAALHTGRYGARTGIGDSILPDAFDIQASEIMLPEVLDLVGYTSAVLGKLHLSNFANIATAATEYGYTNFLGTPGNLNQQEYDNFTGLFNGQVRNVNTYSPTAITDWTLFFANNTAEPWMAYVAHHAVHTPHHRPPDNLHTQEAELDAAGPPETDPIPYYRAMIEALDNEIGRLVDGLDLTDTTVIVVSDNGSPPAVIADPVPPNRAKSTVWRGGVNTPFFIFGSAVQTPGVSDALVDITDIFSTVIELAGAEDPAGVTLDSVSLVPYLQDPSTPSIRSWTYSERFTPTGFEPRAIWDQTAANDEYVYVRYLDGREALTHKATDPWQFINLLDGPLSSAEQAAYDELKGIIDTIELGGTPPH